MGESKHFGEFFRAVRKEIQLSLRDFCKLAQADPGNISRMERGEMPPPQDQNILRRYAEALKIKPGSDSWYRFLDFAAADRGIIPQDLMSDEEVVKMLPVFFRTIRGQKPTEDEMREIAKKLYSVRR